MCAIPTKLCCCERDAELPMLEGAAQEAATFTLLALEATLVEQDPNHASAVATPAPALNLVSVHSSDEGALLGPPVDCLGSKSKGRKREGGS
jgi:hypothetical protein